MELIYKLKQDVIARIAANLSWDLSQLHSSVHISKTDRVINGKSLIGVLTLDMRMGDEIKVTYDDAADLQKIKEIFDELGGEV